MVSLILQTGDLILSNYLLTDERSAYIQILSKNYDLFLIINLSNTYNYDNVISYLQVKASFLGHMISNKNITSGIFISFLEGMRCYFINDFV